MDFAWRFIFKINFIRSAAGPDSSGATSSNRRLQQTQAQVDEVRYTSVCLGAADFTCAHVYSYGTITGEQNCLADFQSDQWGSRMVQYYQARNQQVKLFIQNKGPDWDKRNLLVTFFPFKVFHLRDNVLTSLALDLLPISFSQLMAAFLRLLTVSGKKMLQKLIISIVYIFKRQSFVVFLRRSISTIYWT